MKSKSFLMTALICSLITICLHAQDYAVGVKSYFIKDYARLTEGLAYRPILVNIWYPGEADTKIDYINVKDLNILPVTDTTTSKFSEAYYKYVVKNLDYTLFSRLDDVDSIWKNKELKSYLNTKTKAQKDLQSIKDEKFPLVIFHQGLGGTMDDNYVLCDLLASKGFVVVGSTFFQELESMSPGHYPHSKQDVNMLLNEMVKLPNVDFDRIFYIGHSYGAQAGFTIMSQEGSPIDLFIFLDSTFDHNEDKVLDGIWHYIMPAIQEGYPKVRTPSIHFASKREGNNFNVPKRHIYSERKIIETKKYITHNSFISVGYHEAKIIKEKMPDYDIDTSYNAHINNTILSILTNWSGDIKDSKINPQLFEEEYLQPMTLFDSMSEYEKLIQNTGLDSTLRFIHYINKIDKSTNQEMGWLADYFLQKNDPPTAKLILEYYLQNFPEFWYSQFIHAKYLMAMQKIEESKTYLIKAYELTYNYFEKNEIKEYCELNGITFK